MWVPLWRGRERETWQRKERARTVRATRAVNHLLNYKRGFLSPIAPSYLGRHLFPALSQVQSESIILIKIMPQTQEISSGADFALRTTVRRFQSAASPATNPLPPGWDRAQPQRRPAEGPRSPPPQRAPGGPGTASCQGREAAAEAGAGGGRAGRSFVGTRAVRVPRCGRSGEGGERAGS